MLFRSSQRKSNGGEQYKDDAAEAEDEEAGLGLRGGAGMA